ncbi:MAG: hypothetical protein OEV66_05590 [Spirochaetia bacterium]|nr:hypothetical protein [Spirochaetia bacterium]
MDFLYVLVCMRELFYKYKIIIPILIISIIYNLFWFSIFIYLSLEFSLYRISITILFLLFYIMLAQPAKDYFLHSIFFKLLYPDTSTRVIQDTRIKELVKKSDIPVLLKILLKELNLNAISMITIDHPFVQENFLRDTEQTIRKISAQDFMVISKYFQTNLQHTLSIQMPEEIKNIADLYSWNTIIPVYYKSRYFGFLAVRSDGAPRKMIPLEALAGRTGLILENEILTESAINNESFKKEFGFARHVERFLVEPKPLESGGYQISIDKSSPGITNFPVLFEKSLISNRDDGMYMVFCKISKSNRKMRTMMLFMIAGYFLMVSRYSKNLNQLYKSLNQLLCKNGSEFSVDGFLIEKISSVKWRVCFFGKNIRLKENGQEMKLTPTPPMGVETDDYHFVDLKNPTEIIFYLAPMIHLKIADSRKIFKSQNQSRLNTPQNIR